MCRQHNLGRFIILPKTNRRVGEWPVPVNTDVNSFIQSYGLENQVNDSAATNIAEMVIQSSTMEVTKSLRTLRNCQLKDPR